MQKKSSQIQRTITSKSFTMIGKLSSRRFAFHRGLLIIFHIVDRDDDEKNRFQFTIYKVLQLETNNCAVLVEVYKH